MVITVVMLTALYMIFVLGVEGTKRRARRKGNPTILSESATCLFILRDLERKTVLSWSLSPDVNVSQNPRSVSFGSLLQEPPLGAAYEAGVCTVSFHFLPLLLHLWSGVWEHSAKEPCHPCRLAKIEEQYHVCVCMRDAHTCVCDCGDVTGELWQASTSAGSWV